MRMMLNKFGWLQILSLIFRTDPSFKNFVTASIIGIFLTVILFVSDSDDGIGIRNLASLLALFLEFYILKFLLNELKTYQPGPGKEVDVQKKPAIARKGLAQLPINELQISPMERRRGFRMIQATEDPRNLGSVSDCIDNWLTQNPSIQCTVSHVSKADLLVADTDLYRYQMMGLFSKISSSTFFHNELKLALEIDLEREMKRCHVRKTEYFVNFATNELFASALREGPAGTSAFREFQNLTNYFPYGHHDISETESVDVLSPLQDSPVSNGIGVTVIPISADGYPIFFTQKAGMAIGAGRFTVPGSGSVDFHDIRRSGKDDLLGILRFAMAREYLEEIGKARQGLFRDLSNKNISSLADKILVTGFFRWLDRCGKPEFLGVMKVPESRHQIRADGKEVADFTIDGNRTFVSDADGFRLLYERLSQPKFNGKIGTSTAFALRRLGKLALSEPAVLQKLLDRGQAA